MYFHGFSCIFMYFLISSCIFIVFIVFFMNLQQNRSGAHKKKTYNSLHRAEIMVSRSVRKCVGFFFEHPPLFRWKFMKNTMKTYENT